MAGPPSLWVITLPSTLGEPTPIYIKNLNTTTTTSATFLDINASKSWKDAELYQGYFHPFDSPLAKFGATIPIAYIIFAINIVPSWALMLLVTLGSRTIM